MLNLNVYLAGLTSTLTFEKIELPINKLEDLLTTDGYQIITYKGNDLILVQNLLFISTCLLLATVDEAYFSEATAENNKVAKEVYDKMIKPNPDRALFVNVTQVKEKSRKLLWHSCNC